MYDILDRVDSPSDIRELDNIGLERLCAQIRAYMLECCSRNPGHLASSLGAVELIVGAHYVFNTPWDKLVFDVGHQAYAHKIITGRREAFATIRRKGGISGFPKMDESEYDAFGVGHSSTSVSAALGMAEAAKLQGLDRKVIAIIGDGALTGGMAFEGLNNAGDSNADLLVLLNDNDHSIDDNHGALRNHLLNLTTGARYNRIKTRVWNQLGESGFRRFIQRWLKSLKSWLVKGSGGDLFEAMGFRYFGPIDGNDISKVTETLRKVGEMKGPRIIHCITVKGKGFAPAEADPTTWHAPGQFDPLTGERKKTVYEYSRYQDVFGKVLCELAERDSSIVGITPAMATGCGMSAFAARFPDRFFDVGIEEEHAVTFAAGLAAGGMKPVCNIYSSFSQRAYDQIIHDIALQHLPVTICLDRAGLVGEDGATHNGAFDMAAYRSIPGATIAVPSDELELRRMMCTALESESGPFIIRYPRGTGEGADWEDAGFGTLEPGKAVELLEGDTVAIVCLGPVVHRALEAASDFPGEVGVYDFRFLKPLDEDMLDRIADRYKAVLTLEDGCLKGGLYGAVCEYFGGHAGIPVEGTGIPDTFIGHARQAAQRAECGLDAEGVRKKIKKILENSK